MERYDSTSRAGLLDSYLDAEWSAQSELDNSDFVNSSYDLISSAVTAVGKISTIVASVISFVVMFIGSLVVGGVWALGIVLGGALLALAFRPLNSRSHRAGRNAKDASRKFGQVVWDNVSNAVEMRVYGIGSTIRERNQHAARLLARTTARQLLLSNNLSSLYSTAIYLITAAGLSAILLIDFSDPATIVAVVMMLYRGLGYGQSIQGLYQTLLSLEPKVSALIEMKNKLDLNAVPHGGRVLPSPSKSIVVDHVGLVYPDGTVGLRDVSFSIEFGGALGIIGPSGSGKSSLVQVLLRLRLPTTGSVLIDGTPLSIADPESWFGRAVIVPQAPRLFHTSIRENVRAFRSSISDEMVRESLAASHVLEEIEQLPKGLETDVGDDRLSGGQRQRIAIARALAGQPELLILDEPTSALDLPSEEAIRETLRSLKGQVTLVIVAHRLSTLRICDQILVLRDGQKEAMGDRSTLEAESDFYAEAIRLGSVG